MNEHLTLKQWEQVSAALDGKLNPKERGRMDSALQSDPGMKKAMDELAAFRAFLRSIPQHKAPRSFTLKTGQVKPFRSRNLIPIFRMVSVAASVLMAALFTIEFLPGLFAPRLAAAPASSDRITMESMAIAAPTSEPLILWNGVTSAPQVYRTGGGWGVGGGAGGGDGNLESMAIAPPLTGTLYPGAISEQPVTKEEALPAEGAEEGSPALESTPELIPADGGQTVESASEADAPFAPVANPIIGIRPTQEWGQAIQGAAAEQPLRQAPAAPAFPWLRFAEIGLGALALAAALIAILSRHQH